MREIIKQTIYKRSFMNRSSIIFLQFVVVLTGIAALAFMLWEPHIEGRNVNATTFDIYFKDPFLAFAYIASIPFFILVYKAFRVLGYIGQKNAFSHQTVKALKIIKHCAITIVGFAAIGEVFIMLGESDDHAGGVFMGMLITFTSITIAAAANVFGQILQNGIDLKLGMNKEPV